MCLADIPTDRLGHHEVIKSSLITEFAIRVELKRMITFGLLGLYTAFSGLVIFVLLFGGLPACQGTPIGRLHWLVTEGWVDATR